MKRFIKGTLKVQGILEPYTHKVCEMFDYKHAETIKYVKMLKISPIFKKNTNFTGE